MRSKEQRHEGMVDDLWAHAVSLLAPSGNLPPHPEFGDLRRAAAEAAQSPSASSDEPAKRPVMLTTRNGKPFLRF